VIEFLGELVENLFRANGNKFLYIKERSAKVKVSKTLKPEELVENKSKSLY